MSPETPLIVSNSAADCASVYLTPRHVAAVAVALPPSPGPECPLFAYPTPTAPPHSSVVASAAPQVMSSNPGLYMVPAIELNPATNDNLAAMGEGSDM